MSNNQYPGIGSLIITNKGVEKMLLNLNAYKAAGPDELHGKLLKNTAKESAPLLQAIFQCSIESGAIPEAWKKATISPVYKKSDRSDPANYCNYRPVSLTCISCKILEHIINRHILDHLDKHNILADAQHAFRKRRSCKTQRLLTCVAIPTDREFTSPSRYAISMVARASSSLGVTCLGDPLVKLESPTSMSNTN